MQNGSEPAKGPVPPYVPYKTFRNFIDSLRQGMPGRIDRSLMGTLAGGTQAQLLSALRYLGLITEHGTPTERLTRLVHSEGSERQAALRDALTSAYPSLFDSEDHFKLETATAHQFEEQFKRLNIRGDTVRKAQAFFIAAAKDADVPLSRYVSGRGPGRPASKAPRPRVVNAGRTSRKPDETPPSNPPAPQAPTWAQLLLSKFPSFDPAWSPEVQSKWFDAFDRLMRQGQGATADEEEPE